MNLLNVLLKSVLIYPVWSTVATWVSVLSCRTSSRSSSHVHKASVMSYGSGFPRKSGTDRNGWKWSRWRTL